MLGIDANDLVRFLVRGDEAQFEKAHKLIKREVAAGRRVFVNQFACIHIKESKTEYLKHARQSFVINPARTYACGDEYSDYLAAIGAGTHSFVVSYGFEDSVRLTKKLGVPREVISTSPAEFVDRLLHALNLSTEERQPKLLTLQDLTK